jgi:hypothetical protein
MVSSHVYKPEVFANMMIELQMIRIMKMFKSKS